MPMCSYCYQAASDDCSSWSEARACTGITGPDDPKRLVRVAAHRRREAEGLLREADRIEAETAGQVAAKRAHAARLVARAEEIDAALAAAAAA